MERPRRRHHRSDRILRKGVVEPAGDADQNQGNSGGHASGATGLRSRPCDGAETDAEAHDERVVDPEREGDGECVRGARLVERADRRRDVVVAVRQEPADDDDERVQRSGDGAATD